MIIVYGASHGAVIKLQCPKCGEVQARARRDRDARYACRRCGEQLEVRRGAAGDGERGSRRGSR